MHSSRVAVTKYLETYTLQEILEWNDITEEECLEYLLDEGFLQLPLKPTDVL